MRSEERMDAQRPAFTVARFPVTIEVAQPEIREAAEEIRGKEVTRGRHHQS